jgi:hypothetical protein
VQQAILIPQILRVLHVLAGSAPAETVLLIALQSIADSSAGKWYDIHVGALDLL